MNMSPTDKAAKALSLARKIGGRDGLNCVAELDPTAMEQARDMEKRSANAPLWGEPVLVKDNIDVKGLHTTAGSLALDDNIAKEDAKIVRNLRRNGAVILGKTNMTEFANYTTVGMPGGYSSRGGQVIHAADPSLSPSGSSSGSAVAVAAGIVSAAVGTDTSFSVIACAQQNGICGLKPPVGALSSEGIVPIAKTLDSAGAMTRCFRDALRLYSAMRDEPLPGVSASPVGGLRIAVNTANSGSVSSGQREFRQDVISRLKDCGANIAQIEQGPSAYQRTIMQWEFRPHLEEYLRTSSASRKTLREIVEYYEQNPDTMMRYGAALLKKALDETPGGLQGAEYLRALDERAAAIRTAGRALEGYDAVIMTGPTNIMHFCGWPSVAVTSKQKGEYGVSRGLIMYGTDELRLYEATLAIEELMME